MTVPRKFLGLLTKRERWGLSRGGCIFLGLAFVIAPFLILRYASRLLTVDDGGAGQILVVEGWIPAQSIGKAAQAFHAGRYESVVVVRNARLTGNKWESNRYTADWVAAELVEKRVPADKVHVLFSDAVSTDRTYTCAVAIRQWLESIGRPAKSVDVATLAAHTRRSRLLYQKAFGNDVATLAAHTRRSRLLYQKAFGNDVAVAAIALPQLTFDPDHWWRTSEGVREVPFELFAYLYVCLFFSADA